MIRLFFISSLFICLAFVGQNDCPKKRRYKKQLRIAQAYLNLNQPEMALPIFDELYVCDSSNLAVTAGLGIACLSATNRYPDAEKCLKRALNNGNVDMSFYLADLYLKTYRFDLAKQMVEKYASEAKAVNYEEVDVLRRKIERATIAYNSPSDVKLELLGDAINSRYSDYSPIITEDGSVMFFTSRRHDGITPDKALPEPADENIYMAQNDEDTWQHAAKLAAPVNSSTHDATVTLLNNGKQMVFYRTHQNITGGNLLVTDFENEHWSEPKGLNASINSEFQESSAWISADGNTIFFASNRPGGYGGKDIYRLVKLPNGEWSKALNLGPSINSPDDEDGPIYHEDTKTLYFMSNGHTTIGGFDIFYASWSDEGNVWKSAVNMGYPVNSTNDDVYFVLDKSGLFGYFSSDRSGGYGSQDIYKLELPVETGYSIIRASVYSNKLPVQAKISLIEEESKELIGIYNSNPINGAFVMVFEPNKKYKMIIEAEGLSPMIEYVESNSHEEIQNMTFTLEK